jgi:aspartyl-tRNA(Asn)/glutamyl-tRNA(Gln) amidotransferase subunit A
VISIQRGRQQFIAMLNAQLGDALLVMPTTVITAPEVAPLDADDELFHKVNMRALRNTTAGNVLDLCAVALPNGRDGKGLPTSILFSAARGDDERLLGYALALERVVGAAFAAG